MQISQKTKVTGEKEEGLEIIHNVQTSLNEHEQIFFFFFFVTNGELFHLTIGKFFFENLFEETKINFNEIVDCLIPI